MSPGPANAFCAVLVIFLPFIASGQTGVVPDAGGNGLLKGTYAFREIAYFGSTMCTLTGSMVFDGNGNYTLNGIQVGDCGFGNGPNAPYTQPATYQIGSNARGWITDPIAYNLRPFDYPDRIVLNYGAVSQGAFMGSRTEDDDDIGDISILIAIPIGSAPSNAGFTSVYQTGLLDFAGGNTSAVKNALFNLSPDGQGGLGTIALNGQASNVSPTSVTQSISGATYNFNGDGSATLTVPPPSGTSSTALFSGTKTMFESADGNFVLGWAADGFDIFFGVKALAAGTGTNSLGQGLYCTAGIEFTPASPGLDPVNAYYGLDFNTGDAAGDAIVYQRLTLLNDYDGAVDFRSDDKIALNPDGNTGPDYAFGYQYVFGAGGMAYVGIGSQGTSYSLVVGLRAPTFAGTSVYLDPTRIYNAASFQPVRQISPGELITLFGSGLAPTTMAVEGGQAVPLQLGGVSATVDGLPAPVFAVSPSQISILVPQAVNNQVPGDFTYGPNAIQVTNNGMASNVVQVDFLMQSLATNEIGVFSQTQNGLGLAAARHAATGELVDEANPAQPGEYISIYATGLGVVTPAIADGAVAPSSPMSKVYSQPYVYFNDYGPRATMPVSIKGTVQFAGLAPGLAGLYQVNVLVPETRLNSGDLIGIEILCQSDGSDINQIYIPYGPGAEAPVAKQPTTHAGQ
jgi:uncharacterized protein (TIGR03437 family)